MPDGKICYIEIPSTDIDASAAFYAAAFKWVVRTRENGERAFDDTTGAVSGTWVLGRLPSKEVGMLTYIMVDDIDATALRIVESGGQIATPKVARPSGDALATFLDPAGNLFGLYQEPPR